MSRPGRRKQLELLLGCEGAVRENRVNQLGSVALSAEEVREPPQRK